MSRLNSVHLISERGCPVIKFWKYKSLDNVWCWNGWPYIKWPFGMLLLWAILTLIWNANTIPDYDQRISRDVTEYINATVSPLKELNPSSLNVPQERIRNQ